MDKPLETPDPAHGIDLKLMAVAYAKDMASTRAAFASNAHNTIAYAAGLRASNAFNAAQKMAAGEFERSAMH